MKNRKKTRSELVYRNCRIANRIDNEVNSKTEGLKNRLPEMMWKYSFTENSLNKTAALGNSDVTVEKGEIYGHFFIEDARERERERERDEKW